MTTTKYIDLLETWNGMCCSVADKATAFYLSWDDDAIEFANEITGQSCRPCGICGGSGEYKTEVQARYGDDGDICQHCDGKGYR